MPALSKKYAETSRVHWRVTWVHGATAERQSEARDLAALLRLEVLRPKDASQWLSEARTRSLLILRRDGRPAVRPHGEKPWVWHLGMAKSRLAALRAGQPDRLVRALSLTGQDALVFDGHLGLAHDALVVAASGARVVGSEIDPVLGYVTECGLRALGSAGAEMRAIVSRIDLRIGHHLDVLEGMSGRFDATMFSPMFIAPDFTSPDMEAWRRLASHAPLSPQALAKARQCSERVVIKVLKEEIEHLPPPHRLEERDKRRVVYAVYE